MTPNGRDLLCRYMRLTKAAARQANEKPSGWFSGKYLDKAERCRPEEHDFLFAVRQYEIGRNLNRSAVRLSFSNHRPEWEQIARHDMSVSIWNGIP